MAILSTDILSFANNQLARSLTDIDEQIKLVINDLRFLNVLEAQDTSKTLSDGSTYLDEPDYFKLPISIVLNDGSDDLEPLKPMPGGYKGYRQAMEEFTSGDESQPEYYARFNGMIYVYPTADKAYTSIIDFYKKHPLDPDSIEFDDDFAKCFNFGATYYVAVKFALSRYIAIWGPTYSAEINKIILAHPGQPKYAGGS